MSHFETLLLLAVPILMALTIHEFAHGWTAWRLGDPTPRVMGRLTLNPFAHLDPIGTIMLFLFYFGWAKPVPVNLWYFRRPLRDMAIVAAAGPVSNVLLAAVLGWGTQWLINADLLEPYGVFYRMLTLGVFINLMLAFFNLLPIPPLDGAKVVSGVLPSRWGWAWAGLERWGAFLLLGVILVSHLVRFPLFGMVVRPPAEYLYALFTGGMPLVL